MRIPSLIVFIIIVLAATLQAGANTALAESKNLSIKVGNITIHHPPGLEPVSANVKAIVSSLTEETGATLGLAGKTFPMDIVILPGDRFVQLTGTSQIMAFADPAINLIVVDYDALHSNPMVLRATLKHEIAHIMLGTGRRQGMPKWLNEGIAQWASGGHSEIRTPRDTLAVSKAYLSQNLLPMESLSSSFPSNGKDLRLAYAQSLSAVDYLVRTHGDEALTHIISDILSGLTADEAFKARTGRGLKAFTRQWEDSLTPVSAWISFIGNYINELVMVVGAMALIIGFARVYYRIKTYKDQDDEDESVDYMPAPPNKDAKTTSKESRDIET